MNVSGGLWSTLARARSFSLGVAMAFSAASLVGHMGSWFPHTRLGLREVVTLWSKYSTFGSATVKTGCLCRTHTIYYTSTDGFHSIFFTMATGGHYITMPLADCIK